MTENLEKIKSEGLQQLDAIGDLSMLQDWETHYLGRKRGLLTEVLKNLSALSVEEKKAVGPAANQLKHEFEEALFNKREALLVQKQQGMLADLDITRPGTIPAVGDLHPITKAQRELEDIFLHLGFTSVEGPELETDYYNFESLNIPKGHPARDMWDTFYVRSSKLEVRISNPEDHNSKFDNDQLVLRTHTSPMQVRIMETYEPPFNIIVPGRTFRNEATDARHEHTFNQLEGLAVGKNISVANLKHVLRTAMSEFFGKDLAIQLRPSYFPFVEPGFEVAVQCTICGGSKCSTCGTGWIELLGAGMVHPKVFEFAGYPPGVYTGFAFGFGLSRFAMIKYGIQDVRLFALNDYKFLSRDQA